MKAYNARRVREVLIPWVCVRDDDVHYVGQDGRRYEMEPRWLVYPEGGRPWDGSRVEIIRDGAVFQISISGSRMDPLGAPALIDALSQAKALLDTPGFDFPVHAERPEQKGDPE